MLSTETLREFYLRVLKTDPGSASINNAGSGHFNVFRRGACRNTPYGRRDFYKICLAIGSGTYTYADRSLTVTRPALIFSNPYIPYAWDAISDEQTGWYCLFTEAFVHPAERKDNFQDSPLFRRGELPTFYLNRAQQKEITGIFLKMHQEMSSDYIHKFDLCRNYLHLIVHEAMKMQPVPAVERDSPAASRITHLFLELLERQFPVDLSEGPLKMKTAKQFADALTVHVNHLNRALKEATGKTTTEHLSARIIGEAMALLHHSDWNISEIAYGLGFEYPAYFTIFFKKQTGLTPVEARLAAV